MVGPLDDGLTVRAIGPATAAGRIPLSELARIAATLQATLERLAMSIAGGRQRSGRRPIEIANAVRMDFVGFSEGSAVLELDRATPGALDDLLSESFDMLTRGLSEIRETGERPTGAHFTSTVLNGLASLCGGIGKHNLTKIEFSSGGRMHFTLDREIQSRIRHIRRATVEQDTIIVGRLHMGDFDPMALRCRVDTNLGSIWCDFDVELKDNVFDHLDQLVAARGTAELQADGVSVRILHLTEIAAMDTARSRSLDHLAEEQGVGPLDDVRQLRGEPIDDFELFLEAIRGARGAE
jgi:hypothetical protein